MFVKFEGKSLISLGREPFAVRHVDDVGTITVELDLALMPQAFADAQALQLSVFSHTQVGESPFSAAMRPGQIDTEMLVQAIKHQIPNARSRAQAKAATLLVTQSFALSEFLTSTFKASKSIGVKHAKVLQGSHDERPLVQPARVEQTFDALRPDEHLMDSILVDGVDPSEITAATHGSGTTRRGVLAGVLSRAGEPLKLALQKHRATLTAGSVLQTSSDVNAQTFIMTVTPRDPTLPVVCRPTFKLREDQLSLLKAADAFHVTLELLGPDSVLLDRSELNFDLNRQLAVYHTPRHAARVVGTVSRTGVTLRVSPGDSVTKRIRASRRDIANTDSLTPGYTVIGEYAFDSRQHEVKLNVPHPGSAVSLYRFVSLGADGHAGADYKNFVIKGPRPSPQRKISVTALATDDGLLIEARGIPPRARSIQFTRRNKTLHDREDTLIGTPIVIDDTTASTDYMSMIDGATDLHVSHVYEYACNVVFKDGMHSKLGHTQHVYRVPSSNTLTTQITNAQVGTNETTNQVQVSFGIASQVALTEHDHVKTALARQGMTSLFSAELLAEREKLSSLIVHHVSRVDLTTGTHEDFGIVSDSVFVDSSNSHDAGPSPLLAGRKYRYEVSAVIRAPETMFTELVNTKIDPITKKSVMQQPSRHLHPFTLSRGTIVSPASLKARHGASDFESGFVSQPEIVTIEIPRADAHVINVNAAFIAAETVAVTWQLDGSADLVDHFVVTETCEGETSLVGKCHPDFINGSFQLLVTLPINDVSTRAFNVTPVSYDYKVGTAASSNEISSNTA